MYNSRTAGPIAKMFSSLEFYFTPECYVLIEKWEIKTRRRAQTLILRFTMDIFIYKCFLRLL